MNKILTIAVSVLVTAMMLVPLAMAPTAATDEYLAEGFGFVKADGFAELGSAVLDVDLTETMDVKMGFDDPIGTDEWDYGWTVDNVHYIGKCVRVTATPAAVGDGTVAAPASLEIIITGLTLGRQITAHGFGICFSGKITEIEPPGT